MPFRWNPLSSNFDIVDSDGGGGGGDITLTPDDGAALLDSSFPVEGAQAGSVPVMRTTNVGGTFFWENRAWTSQYVVDPSTTVGLRGTFSTIQAALTQAAADGMTHTNTKMIYVRAGAYTEDLSIPDGALIVGETYSYPTGGIITPLATSIVGNHTPAGNGIFAFNNVVLTNTSSSATFSGGAVSLWFFHNCFFGAASTGPFVNVTADNSHLAFSNCTFQASGSPGFLCSGSGCSMNMFDCNHETPVNLEFDGDITMKNVSNCGNIDLSSGASLHAYSCSFTSSSGSNIHHSGGGTANGGVLSDCTFVGGTPSIASDTSSTSARWFFNGVSRQGGASQLFDDDLFYEIGNGIQGNLMKSHRFATDQTLTLNNYYVGITSTDTARTINLPEAPDNNQDQVIVVKDEGGNAGTNNITITTNSGTPTIDGATSYVIDQDYGSVTLIYAGNDEYFVVNETKGQAVVESVVASGSAVGLTTATPANITSISLRPGKWMLTGVVVLLGNPTLTSVLLDVSISTTSATLGTTGDNNIQSFVGITGIAPGITSVNPSYILDVSTTTTVYLVSQCAFSAGTTSAYGRLTAVKIA